jgi:preprotein translocase subunit YajC
VPEFPNTSWWASQPEATEAAPGATEPAPGGAPPPPGCAGAGSQFLLIAVMFAVFYFLLIRPQQKRQRETDDMLKSLRKGDKVRTSGGIRGEIVDLDEQEVALLVADKVKIHVLRSHIASRIEKPAADAKAKA